MPRYSEEIKQEARELYAQGLSQREIGRRLGVPQQTACRWVNPESAERNREYVRQWDQKNSERTRERKRRWYQKNPELAREVNRRSYEKNKKSRRVTKRQWAQENKEIVRESCAFRRAAKRRATPPWLTPDQRKQITALHAEAKRLEKRTGAPHHVDHIIPLHTKRGRAGEQIACGLHVPWNLQVLPAQENIAKWCKLPDPEHWTAPAQSGIMEP